MSAWITAGAVAIVAAVAFSGHIPGSSNDAAPPSPPTASQSSGDCHATVEAESGDATPADHERTQQMANGLCDALRAAESGAPAPPPPAPTAQDLADTRKACEDLHRQGFMTDVDCATVKPSPTYYYHH